MALLFHDSFDSYTASAQLVNRWTVGNPTFLPTGGKFGNGAVQLTFVTLSKIFSAVQTDVGQKIRFGAYFKLDGAPTSTQQTCLAFDVNSGTQIFPVAVSTAGKLQMRALGSSTALLTSTTTVADGQYHWVEMEWLLATTAVGSVTLYVDGISQGSVTNVITCTSASNALISGFYLWNASSNTAYFDDPILWTDQDTDFTVFPIGPQQITLVRADGDSTPLQFTPNTGTTHYSQINGGYNNVNYVQDGGTGNVDMYTVDGLSYNPANVRAVSVSYWAQNPGTATANLIPKLKTGTTTVDGTTRTLGSGGVNTLNTQIWYKDATNAAWTTTTVNGMEFGIGD